MARRFQFSLRRLLGATALFAVSLCLLRPRSATILAFPPMLGAAIGQLFGRPFVGALAAVCLIFLGLIVADVVAAIVSAFH